MKKKITALTLAAVMAFSALTVTVSAKELVKENGKLYCRDDESGNLKGWHEIDGKTYYFLSSGEAAVKPRTIGGVRYSFSSDGVCKGKYTGFSKSGGKRYYYIDGVKQKSWVKLSDGWHYFGENGAEAVGVTEIYGSDYTFSDKGVWDGKAPKKMTGIYNALNKKLSKDDFGGVYADDGAIIVMSVNDENVEKVAAKLRKYYAPIIIKHCKYSAKELEEVRAHIAENMKKYGICGVGTYVMDNCIGVEMEKENAEFEKYLSSLPDRDIVFIRYGVIEAVDD